MHISFNSHGKGSAKSAANYLLQEKDSKGQVREAVEVLRGDPHLVADTADSLPFVHRYTSGVIAFHADDKPTQVQIDTVLNDFERVAFAGLEADQYSYTAVRHDEPDSCHIHILAARCELKTGKSLNIAPPGWQHTYDALRDMHNARNGWVRPEIAKNLTKERETYDKPTYETRKQADRAIEDWLTERVVRGEINDHRDVLAALSEIADSVKPSGSRAKTPYIAVKLPEFDKNIRLKGALYEREFSSEALRSPTSEARSRYGQDRGIDLERASEASKQLESAIERRAGHNQSRYCIDGPEPQNAREATYSLAGADGSKRLDRHLRGHLGADYVQPEPDRGRTEAPTGYGIPEESPNMVASVEVRRDVVHPDRAGFSDIRRGWEELPGYQGAVDDRAGEQAIEYIEKIGERAAGSERVYQQSAGADRRTFTVELKTDAVCRGAERACHHAEQASGIVVRAVDWVKEKAVELARAAKSAVTRYSDRDRGMDFSP